jgi:hypothetical protein
MRPNTSRFQQANQRSSSAIHYQSNICYQLLRQQSRLAIVAARLPACLILTWRFHDAITLM